VSEALWGFLGVIIGAAVSLLGEQFATKREREAREALREQKRKDARDIFQREAIIAVHDAVTDYWKLRLEIEDQFQKARKASPESVDVRTILSPMRPASSRVTATRAKIFDDELRRLVEEFHFQIEVAIINPPEKMREAGDAANQLREQIEERVNALLRHLF
jgi:gas vesicle protein